MRFIIALVLALTLVWPAFAFHCPKVMKDIDHAFSRNPQLSGEQMTKVGQQWAEGEQLHKGGQHQEAVDTLAMAKKILGIK